MTNRSVTLTWTDSLGETGYRVRYVGSGISSSTVTLDANTTSHTFADLSPNKRYVFLIVPFNEDGSTQSSLAVTTLLDPPTAIRNFTATTIGPREVQLTWADSIGETRYSIYRVIGTNGRQLVASLSSNSTSYRITGLAARNTRSSESVSFE